MNEVTQILADLAQGDAHAAEQLLPLVYEELRKLAAARMADEAPGNTLNATALVHEAYLRLVEPADAARWDNRGHFFAAAAEAMRRILINRARDKGRLKRGGSHKRIDLEGLEFAPRLADPAVAVQDRMSNQRVAIFRHQFGCAIESGILGALVGNGIDAPLVFLPAGELALESFSQGGFVFRQRWHDGEQEAHQGAL